ncbi:MAG: ribonuclease R [Cyanobacteriota bacterium]|nr:ribonuclease R [Cyanobacteriota bacterium]
MTVGSTVFRDPNGCFLSPTWPQAALPDKEPRVEKGTLVEFRHHNERQLAVVQGMEGKKNLLLTVASGQTHSVHPRQISFSLPSRDMFRPQDLAEFWQEVEKRLDPEALGIAWELLQESHRTVELADIAQILFSDTSTISIYATYRLLADDRVYFKQKAESFEPRPPQQVREIQHQLLLAQQKAQEQTEFEQRLRQALTHPQQALAWTAAQRQRLECLERFALHGEASSDREQAHKLLSFLQRSATPEAAFATLVDLQIWSKHENIALKMTGIPTRFSPQLEQWVSELLADPPVDRTQRRDLTHLHTYTIDDASTRDIDDALSVEWLADQGCRVWVHIADPSRWLVVGDPLDLEARRRGTSVYLPEQVIPMFPERLSTGPMSLVQGEVREALSFGVVLDENGGLGECQIVPSWVKVTYRLTYEDADEMLELGAEKELTALATAAHLRFRWRTAQGSITIGLPEQDIKIVDGIPQMRVIEDTPARQMVAEMMILTGEAAAQFAGQQGIPLPYRHQAPPDLPPPEELAQLPPGPVYSFALMRCMSKAEMGIAAAPHAGLGLSAYSQVTSPIRRYADLIAHFQIKAFLAGDPLPFSAEQVQQLILALEPSSSEAVQVERKSKRYWSIEYFRQHPPHIWRALILGHLREYENLALVMIDEVAFRVPVRFHRHVQPGEWINLEVDHADARADVLEFREVPGDSNTPD